MADSTINGLTSGIPTTDDFIVFYDNADGITKKSAISSIPSSGGGVTIGTTAITSGTSGRVLYDNAGVVGELPTSGVSSVVLRDTNQNITVNNVNESFQSIVTATGTTTLTVASPYHTFFTGTAPQTIVLPNATTLVLGMEFRIHSNSSGVVTIQTNGGATIWTMAAGTDVKVTVTDISTAAGVWDVDYSGVVAVSGKKVSVSNSINLAGTDSTTMTFPSTSATIARTDAGQTFTGVQVMTKPTLNAFTNAITADTDGATITFDMSASNIHTVTIGGNRTLAVSNVSVGQCFMLRLTQDATGSRTVTWFTTLKWAGGSAPTLTTTATKADLIGFLCTSAGNYDAFVIAQNI